MTVGIAPADRIFLSAAAGVGNPVVYVGSKTGRDGIHGATMASAEFGADAEEKRPTVQVGDPFTEKLLIEACLELMATDAIVAIQDMGAAGLTSSSVEMAGKGGVGIALDLDAVPQRESGMTAYEMMLSESPGTDADGAASGAGGAGAGDLREMGARFRGDRPDHRQRAHRGAPPGAGGGGYPAGPARRAGAAVSAPDDRGRRSRRCWPRHGWRTGWGWRAALELLLACPDLCSRAWIWEQYNSTIGGQTVKRPGAADAAVVRVEGQAMALALTTDCTPRYCAADPEAGGRAGGGGGLAQPDRGRRPAARDHRQPEFRQSGEARGDGRSSPPPSAAWPRPARR